MKKAPKAVISWSSGKDSAWAYYVVKQLGNFNIVGMVTTLTVPYQRVSMHGVREHLLDLQAKAIGLSCHKVWLPASPCTNEVYEAEMAKILHGLKANGVTHVIFGDLFLEDIRLYREKQMEAVGLKAVFPLWLQDTKKLAIEMIEQGLNAVIVCVDSKKLNHSFAGRTFDNTLLNDIPAQVDSCGENGEFHTVVIKAPFFDKPIDYKLGEVVIRDNFVFRDVVV